MTLSGSQYRQLSSALLSAFDVDGLRALARFELDIDLDAISAGDLEARVFLLIDHAQRSDRLTNLLMGAIRQNPTNAALRALVSGALDAAYSQKKTMRHGLMASGVV